jgi:hypothetical protein
MTEKEMQSKLLALAAAIGTHSEAKTVELSIDLAAHVLASLDQAAAALTGIWQELYLRNQRDGYHS